MSGILSKFLEWYETANQNTTWRQALSYAALFGATYTFYCFFVKPFLSPLRKIPGPGYNPLFGNVREAMMGEAMSSSVKWVQKYGGIVRFYHLLGRERVLIADPEALRHIMVTHVHKYNRLPSVNAALGSGIFNVSGDDHTFQRRLLNPFFNHSSIEGYMEIFEENCQKLIEKWNVAIGDENEVQITVQNDLMCMTLDSVGKAVFGYDFGALDDLYTPAFVAFRNFTDQPGISFIRLLPFGDKLPTAANRKVQESVEVIDGIIYDMINKKRIQLLNPKESDEYKEAMRDMLGKLLLARDPETERGFSELELRDQVLSLLLAGHETTGSTMSWLLLLLANHQSIQEQVRQEVNSVLPVIGQPITRQYLDQLEYLTAVIKEAQRLYPVAPSFYRVVAEDDVIQGYRLPKGTLVVYHVGAMMRNPKIWEEPEKFDPGRFLGDKAKEIDLYTHLPFITGAHKCLGHQFAKMQMKIVLSNLIRQFTFTPIKDLKFKRKLRVTLKAYPPVTLNAAPNL